jgi:uncharacterized protein YjbJ (UPF0337 family)
MDWNNVERMWKQVKGKVQEKWGKLTDDDLEVIDGRRDRLEVKIQQRYGFATVHARKEVDDWVRWQIPASPRARRRTRKSQLALASMKSRGTSGSPRFR